MITTFRMPKSYEKSTGSKGSLATLDGNPVRCLYVTNIPAKTQEKELFNYFQVFGSIKNLFLKRSIKPTTFAFVTFETPEEAYRMYVRRDILKIQNRKLYVFIADTWHQPFVKSDGTVNYNPRFATSAANSILESLFNIMKDAEDQEVEIVNNVEDCPIAKLNDDCLLLVFKFIPFAELHHISHVCMRWRNLMKSYWSKIKTLNFSEEPFNSVAFSNRHLELYLRICPNIKSIHLIRKSYSYHSKFVGPTSESIIKASSLCPNLESLTLEGIDLIGRPMASVAHFCRNLKSLTLRSCEFPNRDDEMNSVMKKCVNLVSLRLANCLLQPGLWIRNLRPGLKNVSFLLCTMNHGNFVKGMSLLQNSLEELELIVEIRTDMDFINLSMDHAGHRKLENFFNSNKKVTFDNGTPEENVSSANTFINLVRLELECNDFLTDRALEGLVFNSPHLRHLNLARSKNSRLTSNGFNVLAGLTELVTLNLSLNSITDTLLISLSKNAKNLEVLSINSCHLITDTGCTSVVRDLFKLKELHVDSCKNLTDEIVNVAVAAANSNKDKESLLIYCADTSISSVKSDPHTKVKLSTESRDLFNWLFSCNLPDYYGFIIDDYLDDANSYDDDDDDDYAFDVYQEDDFSDEYEEMLDHLNFVMEDFDGLPFNLHAEFLYP